MSVKNLLYLAKPFLLIKLVILFHLIKQNKFFVLLVSLVKITRLSVYNCSFLNS